jgi:surfeit locus 1 family protein
MITSTLKMLFSRKLIVATLLVVVAMIVMARLGIWQLDRLAQRRASNAVVSAQLNAARLNLNQALTSTDPAAGPSLIGMQYRSVVVRGTYDFNQQVGLRNQVWSDQIGYDLLTPLRISGTNQIVLVDRGWTFLSDFDAGRLAQYNETGEITVQGVILDSQIHPSMGRMQDAPFNPSKRTNAFFIVNIGRIGQEMPYPLLPVYIQQMPDPDWAGPPYRKAFSLVLSDGPHLSYAIQWFCFALVLGIGYPILVRKNGNKAKDPREDSGANKSDQRSEIGGIR